MKRACCQPLLLILILLLGVVFLMPRQATLANANTDLDISVPTVAGSPVDVGDALTFSMNVRYDGINPAVDDVFVFLDFDSSALYYRSDASTFIYNGITTGLDGTCDADTIDPIALDGIDPDSSVDTRVVCQIPAFNFDNVNDNTTQVQIQFIALEPGLHRTYATVAERASATTNRTNSNDTDGDGVDYNVQSNDLTINATATDYAVFSTTSNTPVPADLQITHTITVTIDGGPLPVEPNRVALFFDYNQDALTFDTEAFDGSGSSTTCTSDNDPATPPGPPLTSTTDARVTCTIPAENFAALGASVVVDLPFDTRTKTQDVRTYATAWEITTGGTRVNRNDPFADDTAIQTRGIDLRLSEQSGWYDYDTIGGSGSFKRGTAFGGNIDYLVTIENTPNSSSDASNMILIDEYDADQLSFDSAILVDASSNPLQPLACDDPVRVPSSSSNLRQVTCSLPISGPYAILEPSDPFRGITSAAFVVLRFQTPLGAVTGTPGDAENFIDALGFQDADNDPSNGTQFQTQTVTNRAIMVRANQGELWPPDNTTGSINTSITAGADLHVVIHDEYDLNPAGRPVEGPDSRATDSGDDPNTFDVDLDPIYGGGAVRYWVQVTNTGLNTATNVVLTDRVATMGQQRQGTYGVVGASIIDPPAEVGESVRLRACTDANGTPLNHATIDTINDPVANPTGEFTCALGNIAAGDSVDILVEAQAFTDRNLATPTTDQNTLDLDTSNANNPLYNAPSVSNDVRVATRPIGTFGSAGYIPAVGDGNTRNNQAVESTRVLPGSDLALLKFEKTNSSTGQINNDDGTTPLEATDSSGLLLIERLDRFPIGDIIEYTIRVVNNGPDDARQVVVTDTLPPGLEFIAASATATICEPDAATGDCPPEATTSTVVLPRSICIYASPDDMDVSSGTITCNLGSMGDGSTRDNPAQSEYETIQVDIAVEVQTRPGLGIFATDPFLSTILANAATVRAAGAGTAPGLTAPLSFLPGGAAQIPTRVFETDVMPDVYGGNNTECERSLITPRADLEVTQRGPRAVVVGSDITYLLTIVNDGPDTATNVYLQDTLPASLKFISVTSIDPATGEHNPVDQRTGLPHITDNNGNLVDPETGELLRENDSTSDQPLREGKIVCSQLNRQIDCELGDIGADDHLDVVIVAETTIIRREANALQNSVLVCSHDAGSSTCNPPRAVTDPPFPTDANGAVILAAVGSSDPDPTNNTATLETEVVPSDLAADRDLRVERSEQDATILEYTATIANRGPGSASNVRMAVPLPTVVNLLSVSPARGSCSVNVQGVLECGYDQNNPINLDANDSMEIEVRLEITGNPGSGNFIIDFLLDDAPEQPDPDASNDQVSFTEGLNVDLILTKTSPQRVAVPGGEILYLINVTNTGSDSATGVVVTDTLPDQVTFVSATVDTGSECDYEPQSRAITCNLEQVPPQDVVDIALLVTLAEDADATSNEAVVTTTSQDSNESNNRDTIDITTISADVVGDLALEVAAPVRSGTTELTYPITITNTGPLAAQESLLTIEPGAELVYRAASIADDACVENDTTITCDLGIIPAGTTRTGSITIGFVDANPDSAARRAAATSVHTLVRHLCQRDLRDPFRLAFTLTATNDAYGSNNHQTVYVPQADLAVEMTGPERIVVNDTLTYRITVTNNGPFTATNVLVTNRDMSPLGITFTAVRGIESDLCSLTGGEFQCSLGSLVDGAVVEFTVEGESTGTGTLSNRVSVSTSLSDGATSNNQSDIVVTSVLLPDEFADLALATTSTISDTSIVYATTITNNGPGAAANVLVQITLDERLTFRVGISDDRCSDAQRTITCALGTLVSGEQDEIIIIGTFLWGTPNVATLFTLQSTTFDFEPDNNQATVFASLLDNRGLPFVYLPLILKQPPSGGISPMHSLCDAGDAPPISTPAQTQTALQRAAPWRSSLTPDWHPLLFDVEDRIMSMCMYQRYQHSSQAS